MVDSVQPAPKRSPAKKAPKTGVYTLGDMPGHKASSSSSGKGVHTLANMEESPAKRVRKDLNTIYEEDAYLSDDFRGLSDEVESSDDEDSKTRKDSGARLWRRPNKKSTIPTTRARTRTGIKEL
ncbi:MAG: hypothetical protein LQ349_009217, partial [Xanthoria aureola]